MEFYSMKERWGKIDGVEMFLYTHVMYKFQGEFFAARLPARYPSPEALPPIDSHPVQEIDGMNIWPQLENGMQVCQDVKKNNYYIKRPQLATYDGSPTLAWYTIHEARMCHILKSYPHINIVKFHGCTVGGKNEITGLCFDKCKETMAERIQRGIPIDTKTCLTQIRNAVEHLHWLGLVHNDICPENIMFRGTSSALVLVDFDSCVAKGTGMPTKRGPCVPGAEVAQFENDLVGLGLIHKFLLQHEKNVEQARKKKRNQA